MASTSSQSYRNLPANNTEISALKKLLDGDLEQRSSILRRQEEVQAQFTFAKKAAEVFANYLATTRAVKDAFAATVLSTKVLQEALKNSLNLYDNHHDILTTISSTKGVLVTWAEIMALTETLLTNLDKAIPQVEAHLHQAADEHAAHESTRCAASESLVTWTDSLRTVDQSIAQNRRVLFGIRSIPTEILPQIFIEAVDARQREIITSLSSYRDMGASHHDINIHSTTLNLVPFTLSGTCKRWRAICQSIPRLWRYTRVPTINLSSVGYQKKKIIEKIIGRSQFEQCVLLARKQPLDLTVYACYNMTHQGAADLDLVLLAESRIRRVNIAWHGNFAIPPGIPSPTELCIVASTNSPTPYRQILPTELLTNTKKLQCTELTPQIDSAVGIKSLHISLSRQGELPLFESLLQNCPQLRELHLEIKMLLTSNAGVLPFAHQQLHTLHFTGMAFQWAIPALSEGCRLPRLTRLVLTDINGIDPDRDMWTTSFNNGQISHITHIEVQAVSAPSHLAHFLPLFEAATALGTLTLSDSAVEPVLELLTLSAPKRVDEIFLCNSTADGRTLREYLAAIERGGGGTSGMKVAWNDCPNFSGVYGGVFGELHL